MKPYTCSTGNKSFTQAGHLKQHMMIHSGVKPFTCDICDKAFCRRDHLNQHMKTHNK